MISSLYCIQHYNYLQYPSLENDAAKKIQLQLTHSFIQTSKQTALHDRLLLRGQCPSRNIIGGAGCPSAPSAQPSLLYIHMVWNKYILLAAANQIQ